MSRRAAALLVVAGIVGSTVTSTVDAQHYASAAGVTTVGCLTCQVGVQRAAFVTTADTFASTAREGRGGRVVQHAVIGTLLGIAVGAAAAFVHTQTGDYTDHSEDGVVYMVLMPVGAVAGTAIGTIVGLVRTR